MSNRRGRGRTLSRLSTCQLWEVPLSLVVRIPRECFIGSRKASARAGRAQVRRCRVGRVPGPRPCCVRAILAPMSQPPTTDSGARLMTLAEWADGDGPGELIDGQLVEEEEEVGPEHDIVGAWLIARSCGF
jgi:hypothetical protein